MESVLVLSYRIILEKHWNCIGDTFERDTWNWAKQIPLIWERQWVFRLRLELRVVVSNFGYVIYPLCFPQVFCFCCQCCVVLFLAAQLCVNRLSTPSNIWAKLICSKRERERERVISVSGWKLLKWKIWSWAGCYVRMLSGGECTAAGFCFCSRKKRTVSGDLNFRTSSPLLNVNRQWHRRTIPNSSRLFVQIIGKNETVLVIYC
jgi:hypothetical protein